MSTDIEFYKTYTRKSRSKWSDNARVVLMFNSESKSGVYLHLGDLGINGFSISKQLQTLLPASLQQQYLGVEYIDIVMHVFNEQIESYCKKFIEEVEFKEVFLLNQTAFFSNATKTVWKESYELFLKQT
jgi:hypothetical protein